MTLHPGESSIVMMGDTYLAQMQREGRTKFEQQGPRLKTGPYSYEQVYIVLVDGEPYCGIKLTYSSEPGWLEKLLCRLFPRLRARFEREDSGVQVECRDGLESDQKAGGTGAGDGDSEKFSWQRRTGHARRR